MSEAGEVLDERQLATFVEAVPDAVLGLDPEGVVRLVNTPLLEQTGHRREDVLGRPVVDLLPARERGGVTERIARFATNPRVVPLGAAPDVRVTRGDGSTFVARLAVTPVSTGTAGLLLVVLRDLTGHRFEEERFRRLLEAAPDPMLILDATGRIEQVNDRAARVFGLAAPVSEALDLEELVPHAGAIHAWREDVLAQGAGEDSVVTGVPVRARRSDGTEFPAEVSLAPLLTVDGLLLSVTVHDISYRVRLHEETDRMKDQFLATISHELRTPLTSVLGYAEILDELGAEHLSDQARALLAVVFRGARRELRLVDDLLTLVQIGEGALAIRPTDIDLRTVAADAVSAAQPQAEDRALTLSMLSGEEPILVRGDTDRLGQALDNLISNAVKFTPVDGSVVVDVSRRAERAVIAVHDTGAGIHVREMDHLYDRLFRGADAVTAQAPGAGLGLSIAKAIIEAHEGSIEVESVVGAGSVFRVELPAVVRDVTDPVGDNGSRQRRVVPSRLATGSSG